MIVFELSMPDKGSWNSKWSQGGDKMSRLIDADALEKALGAWIRDHWTDAFTGDDAGSEFADIIDHAETIDAKPTTHAQPSDSKIENAIRVLQSKYNKALSQDYIRNPIAWALYQTWKEFDR